MKSFALTLGFIVCSLLIVQGQSTRNLLGSCNRDSLLQDPFRGWFQKNYDTYVPDDAVIQKIKKLPLKDFSIEVFFGTWCGDSRRDLPRFYKIADAIGLTASNIKLIAVGSGDKYKQGPNGETLGRGIYRVATFIVSKGGVEVNRITETVVNSLELDLLAIFSGKTYQSNYKGYPLIDAWLKEGSLASENFSNRGMARQLSSLIVTPSELNSCALVLLTQKKFIEAAAVYRMNAFLFYDNPDAYAGLAEALSAAGKHSEALENIEYAISINKDSQSLHDLLNTFYKIKTAEPKP